MTKYISLLVIVFYNNIYSDNLFYTGVTEDGNSINYFIVKSDIPDSGNNDTLTNHVLIDVSNDGSKILAVESINDSTILKVYDNNFILQSTIPGNNLFYSSFSNNGDKIAFIDYTRGYNKIRLYVHNLLQPESLCFIDEGIFQENIAQFNSNDTKIAYIKYSTTDELKFLDSLNYLMLYNVTTGNKEILYDSSSDLTDGASSIAWAPSDSQIAFLDLNRRLMEVNIYTKIVVTLDESELMTPVYSKDGKYLYYLDQIAQGTIRLNRNTLAKDTIPIYLFDLSPDGKKLIGFDMSMDIPSNNLILPLSIYDIETTVFTRTNDSIYINDGIMRCLWRNNLSTSVTNASCATDGIVKHNVSPNPFEQYATFNLSRYKYQYINIYDTNGKLITKLPCKNSVTWDGTDGSGNRVSNGIYLYEILSYERRESGYLIKH